MRRLVESWVVAAVMLVVASAEAAPTAQDRSLAEALFREAGTLIEARDYDAACPKLAESQRLDPQLGTLLHLATCHELQGKTATAWSEYSEAIERATKQGEEKRLTIAKRRAASLEAKLSYLAFEIEAAAPGLRVVLDGRALGSATLSARLPVDPGRHEITANAPGHQSWSRRVNVPVGPSTTKVRVPPMTPVASDPAEPSGANPASVPAPSLDPSTGLGTQLTVGIVVGGLGVATAAAGFVFGGVAAGQQSDADAFCEGRFCTQAGLDGHANARASAGVATGLVVGGGVAAAAGLVVALTAPADDVAQAGWFVAPGVGPDGVSVSVGGRL